MKCAASVDDAPLPRSRTTLTEMLQVLTGCCRLRMRSLKWSKKRVLFLAMLVLCTQLVPETACVSLDLKENVNSLVNISTHQRENGVRIKNLSELIEYSPLDFPIEMDMESSTVPQPETVISKNIKLKLKTHLVVQNSNVSIENGQRFDEINRFSLLNSSETPLSEIEYVEPEEGDEFWHVFMRGRKAKRNSVQETPPDIGFEESNSSISEKPKDTGEIEDSEENEIVLLENVPATSRQFAFHPYLPYGKDVAPDEKISFHDILPVKMVKFIKSMVEEAPWEQMFMKMVRMIVDQFVDKIIEKMFEAKKHDDEHLKRSFDILLSPTWVLPTFKTPVVRMKRSVEKQNDDAIFDAFEPNRSPQSTDTQTKKTAEDRKTWFDHFLDYVFPDTISDEKWENTEHSKKIKKREVTNSRFLKTLVAFFLSKFEKPSGIISDAKDSLRYKLLNQVLPYMYQKRYLKSPNTDSTHTLKMTHRKFPGNFLEQNNVFQRLTERLTRRKRSLTRLWQDSSRKHRRRVTKSRDVCSLRKACNAGRLLSRLPAIEDITLQLRSKGDEPHWDALLWGMKKKRCSRLFCKRQRTPKGARSLWKTGSERRHSRKMQIATQSAENDPEQKSETTV